MKHRVILFMLALIIALTGCEPIVDNEPDSRVIYASFFPIYALSGLVLGDVPGIRLKCLAQPQDECLRLYEISDWDLYMLAFDSDAVIIGGRGLESYESMLYSLGDNSPALITSMYALNLYNQSDNTEITEDSSHLSGANPYYYMSISGARKIVANIASAVSELYDDLSPEISSGAEIADAKLAALYAETQTICADVHGGKVAILNEALIYPAIEYALDVEYWFDRESGTTLYGDSLESLISDIAESGANVVLIEKQAPSELTSALRSAGLSVALINTMTSYATNVNYDGYILAQTENAREIAQAFTAIN